MSDSAGMYADRETHSRERLATLGQRLGELQEVKAFPALTIFGAGSYGRLEASKYSDIDLFFVIAGGKSDVAEPRTNSHRLFGKVIDIVYAMQFPKLSNDAEYLVLLHTEDIVRNLGSRADDHENFFTARMLLLLESRCLYGGRVFEEITESIVRSYFKDYPDHQQTFEPMFLLNDICRYWKTLLLNYENKRAGRVEGSDEEDSSARTRQRVRNYKLKYSRMTTCFASIAALGSLRAPVTEAQIVEMTKLTLRERLQTIATRIPGAAESIARLLDSYALFLEKTGLPTEELEAEFADHDRRIEMFRRAKEYGDLMYELLQVIDRQDPGLRLLRNLAI